VAALSVARSAESVGCPPRDMNAERVSDAEKVQRAFSSADNAVETKTRPDNYFIFCFDDATCLQLLANPPSFAISQKLHNVVCVFFTLDFFALMRIRNALSLVRSSDPYSPHSADRFF
jgi:hypothetical protein